MRKVDELKHLLDIAKMNYRQLGGKLEEDEKEQQEQRETARSAIKVHCTSKYFYHVFVSRNELILKMLLMPKVAVK